MNSCQQLSIIQFLPDKLKIFTCWLSQYVTLLLCHMALDAETKHHLIKWHPNWRSGWYNGEWGFHSEGPLQTGGTSQKEPHEVPQRQTKSCIAGKSTLCTRSGCGLSEQLCSWSLGLTERQLLRTWRNYREGLLRHLGDQSTWGVGEAGATGLFSLEIRRPRGDITAVLHYLNPLNKTGTDFSEIHSKRTKDNSHKLQQEKYWLETWKKNNLSGTSASLKVLFNLHPQRFSKLFKAWSNLIWFWS